MYPSTYQLMNRKLEKHLVQRRIDLWTAEGIKFVTNAHVGVDVDAQTIKDETDAVVIATGATWPRDLNLAGRDAHGVHFAMEYLQGTTKSLLDSNLQDGQSIDVKDADVIVIGGGDTVSMKKVLG
jgi:glutamate synthase (NADPH/NADH)